MKHFLLLTLTLLTAVIFIAALLLLIIPEIYNSLSGIIKELPLDVIKIDRSFVQAIEDKEVDRQLIRSIADMASIFGAKVCIEGIETEGMRDILKQYHVESFQGYYYAKPLLLEQFLEWDKAAREKRE